MWPGCPPAQSTNRWPRWARSQGCSESDVAICAGLGDTVETFRGHSLGHVEFPCPCLDTIYLKVRNSVDGGRGRHRRHLGRQTEDPRLRPRRQRARGVQPSSSWHRCQQGGSQACASSWPTPTSASPRQPTGACWASGARDAGRTSSGACSQQCRGPQAAVLADLRTRARRGGMLLPSSARTAAEATGR